MSFAPLPEAALPEAFDAWLRAIDSGAAPEPLNRVAGNNEIAPTEPPSAWPPGFSSMRITTQAPNLWQLGSNGVVWMFNGPDARAWRLVTELNRPPRSEHWHQGSGTWRQAGLTTLPTDSRTNASVASGFPEGRSVMRDTGAGGFPGGEGTLDTWHINGIGGQAFKPLGSPNVATRLTSGSGWWPWRRQGPSWDPHEMTRTLLGIPDLAAYDSFAGWTTAIGSGGDVGVTAATDGHVYVPPLGSWRRRDGHVFQTAQNRDRRLARDVGQADGRIVTVVGWEPDGRAGVAFRGEEPPSRRSLAVILAAGAVVLQRNTTASSSAGRKVLAARPLDVVPGRYHLDVRWRGRDILVLVDGAEVLAHRLDDDEAAEWEGNTWVGLFNDEDGYDSGSRWYGYAFDAAPAGDRAGILRLKAPGGTTHVIESIEDLGGSSDGAGGVSWQPAVTLDQALPPPDADNVGRVVMLADSGFAYVSTGEIWRALRMETA